MNKEIEMLYKTLEAKDKIINKQVLEIARLKEQLEYLRSNEYLNQVKWERTFNEELVKELQERIDKAKEYIKENIDNTGWLEIGSNCVKELLEILEGNSNE